MASANWTNTQPGVQDWFAAGNWSDDASPTASDDLVIDDNPNNLPNGYPPLGPTIFETGAVASTVTVEGAGFLDIGYYDNGAIDGSLSVGTLTLGAAVGFDAPQVNVSDGSLTAGAVIEVSGVLYNYATTTVSGAITLEGGGVAADGGVLTAGSISGTTGGIYVQEAGTLDTGSLTDDGGEVSDTSSASSSLNVTGEIFINNGAELTIGQASETAAVTATVGSVDNEGDIFVTGSAGVQSALVVDGSGLGSPGVLDGDVQLQGDAVIQFPDGAGITEIAGTLTLIGVASDGPGPQIESYQLVPIKEYVNALDDLTTIDPSGTLYLVDDNNAIFGTYTNKGSIDVDEGGYQLSLLGGNYYQTAPGSPIGPSSVGGSDATLGSVTNDGLIVVGNYAMTTPSSATIGQLQNDANLAVIGSATSKFATATLTLTSAAVTNGNIYLQNYAILNTNGLTIGAQGYLYGTTAAGPSGPTTSAVVNGSVVNNGDIAADGETLTISGPVSGTGTASVMDGTLSFGAAFNQAVSVVGLAGQEGLLKLAQSDSSVISMEGEAVVDLEYANYQPGYEALFFVDSVSGQSQGNFPSEPRPPTYVGDFTVFDASETGTLEILNTATESIVATLKIDLADISDNALHYGSDNQGGILVSAEALPGVVSSEGDILVTDVQGQPYTSYEQIYDGGVYWGADYFYTTVPAGAAYASYVYDVSAGGDLVGSQFFYTGGTGQIFTSEEEDYDGAGEIARVAYAGVTGEPFSAYEYDYVGGVFSGTKVTYTSVPQGATYSSYVVDYNYAGAFSGAQFFYTNITGQSYTGEEVDVDGGGRLSRELLTGVSGAPYSSLELDYSAGTFEGVKYDFTGLAGQSYTAEEVDVSASNQLEKVIYSGMTSTPYSSVEYDYNGGAVSAQIFNFTDVTGQPYYADQVEQNASGANLQQTLDMNSGGHDLFALAGGQTLTSLGDDLMVGSATGATTFVLNAIYGADTIANFTAADTISLPSSEFTLVSQVQSAATPVGNNVLITANDGDKLTIDNMTVAGLATTGTFIFHP